MIRRWFAKLGVWGWLIAAVVGVVALYAVSMVVVWNWHRQQIDAELERLRAAGEPVTLADLKQVYPPPPSELDATRHWLAGFAAEESAPWDPAYLQLPFVGDDAHAWNTGPLLRGRPWPDWALAERYVDERSEVLRHYQAAAKVGGAARIGKYVDGFNNFKPYYDARELIRLAFLVESRRGRTAEALQAIRSHIAIDHALQPWDHTQFGGIGHDEFQRSALKLASTLHPSDEDLAELQTLFRRIDYRGRLRQSVVTSRVLAVRSFENGELDAIVELHDYGLPGRGLSNRAIGVSGPADMHAYLDVMTEFVEASKLPWPQALRKAELLEARRLRDQALSKPWATIAGNRTYDEFVITAIAEALNRATDVALAVARYRLKYGETPTELRLMVPEFLPVVPTDPFTGDPLRYRVEKDGFVVYSVGKDRVDGGGPNELFDPGKLFDPSADPGVRMRDEVISKRQGTQNP